MFLSLEESKFILTAMRVYFRSTIVALGYLRRADEEEEVLICPCEDSCTNSRIRFPGVNLNMFTSHKKTV